MGLAPDLTGRAVLDLLAGLDRLPVDRPRRRDLQERLGLCDADLGRRLREYSTGMKRKLGLIQALEADRPLLILDEPTDGLDPLMQEAFYEILADLQRRGRTVFMCTRSGGHWFLLDKSGPTVYGRNASSGRG
jgi:ABC-2 type transport system ATP-binding protein